VKGELAYDQDATGDVHPNLRTGQAELYGAWITSTEGPSQIDLWLSTPADNPVVLEIGGQAPIEPEGTSYEGEFAITADPSVVPVGVPMRVPVTDDADAIQLEPVDADKVRFTVWTVDGERVTRDTVEDPPALVSVSNRTDDA